MMELGDTNSLNMLKYIVNVFLNWVKELRRATLMTHKKKNRKPECSGLQRQKNTKDIIKAYRTKMVKDGED